MAIIPIQHLIDNPNQIRYTPIQGDYFKSIPSSSGLRCTRCDALVDIGVAYYRHISLKSYRRNSWQYANKVRQLSQEGIKSIICIECFNSLPNNQQREVIIS